MRAKEIITKLDSLSSVIKRSAEILEVAETPTDDLYASVENFCHSTSERILDLIPISIEDYERDFADWKIAWKDNREALLAYCQSTLGEVAKKRKKEPLPTYSKRLLYECHRAGFKAGWKEQLPARQYKATKFVEDQLAHETLKRWGSMSKEAFKADFQNLESELVARAASALGIKTGLKAKTFPDKLHKAAVRFANNTTLF